MYQGRRLVECGEPLADRPLALNRIKSISPIGAIGRGAVLGMDARRTRSATPSRVDARDERRCYGIRGNVTMERTRLPVVSMNFESIRRITEGGTSSQKDLMRNNYKRFSTREAAQAWSETLQWRPCFHGMSLPPRLKCSILLPVLLSLCISFATLLASSKSMGCARNEFSQLGSNRPLLRWSRGHFQPNSAIVIVPNHD